MQFCLLGLSGCVNNPTLGDLCVSMTSKDEKAMKLRTPGCHKPVVCIDASSDTSS